MPIPWLAVLKIVPWTEVITNAPKVVDGAKKLWSSVSNKPVVPAPLAVSADLAAAPEGSGPAVIARLQVRVAALEAASADLHSQMLASTELIRSLADQNAQLIKGIEEHRVRIKWLAGALTLTGVVVLVELARGLAG